MSTNIQYIYTDINCGFQMFILCLDTYFCKY